MGKMLKVLVFLLAIFNLLVIEKVKAEYATFDYFMFVLQWAPSLCKLKDGCERPPPEDFLIHGLWPSNFEGPYLKKCYKKPYDKSLMTNLLVKKLRVRWRNLKKGTDEMFWKRGWKIHGVCSLLWYEQAEYFNLAAERYDKFRELKSSIVSKGIVPGFNKSYRFDEIRGAIQEYTTKVPDLTCSYDKDKNFQWNDLRLCLDPGGTILDCPEGKNSATCTAQELINFPLM